MPVRPLLARASDILALATSSAPWSPAVTTATALAGRWASSLTGCYVDASLRGSTVPMTEPSVLGLLLVPDEDERQAASAFIAMAQRQGVAKAVAGHLYRRGVHPAPARRLARPGRAGTRHGGKTHLFDILGEALLGSRIACLVLPPDSAWRQRLSPASRSAGTAASRRPARSTPHCPSCRRPAR